MKKNWEQACRLMVSWGVLFGVLFCFSSLAAAGGLDQYTKLLIHSDTVDGDISFTDASSSNHTIITNGDVRHSAAQSDPVFGNTAIYFDGDQDYLTIPDSDDFWFEDQDFTIDLWFKLESIPGLNIPLIGQWLGSDTSKRGFYLGVLNSQVFFVADDVNGTRITAQNMGPTISIDNWYHLAAVRSGNTITLYLDGVKVVDTSVTGTLNDSVGELIVGSIEDGSGGPIHGYIDEVRISKGIARWNDDFTPPATPYGPTIVPLEISAFSATPTNGIEPLDVDFSVTATGGTEPYTHTWDFGDGQADTVQNPSHAYTAAGDYTAQVTVTDADGNTVSDSTLVSVQSGAQCLTHAVFDSSTKILTIPYLDIPLIDPVSQQEIPGRSGVFSCAMKYVNNSGGSFSIQDVVYLPDEIADDCHAAYTYDGVMTIPNVDVTTVIALPWNNIVQGPVETYSITLKQLMLNPSYFHLENAVIVSQ